MYLEGKCPSLPQTHAIYEKSGLKGGDNVKRQIIKSAIKVQIALLNLIDLFL